MISKYFLTVDWCNKGNRGIFCDSKGNAFGKDTQHTEGEIWGILDAFSMVLSPQSILFSETELKEYNKYYPLAEFSHQYGYAIKEVQDELSDYRM